MTRPNPAQLSIRATASSDTLSAPAATYPALPNGGPNSGCDPHSCLVTWTMNLRMYIGGNDRCASSALVLARRRQSVGEAGNCSFNARSPSA